MKYIKFRVFDNDEKVMYQQSECMIIFDEIGEIGEDVYVKDGSGVNALYSYEIMQYTGLKDKKGNKIYEGDIVVFYSNLEDEIVTEKVEYHFGMFRAGDSILATVYSKCEIIGNIYENEDLTT